jgi:hypothetical protein
MEIPCPYIRIDFLKGEKNVYFTEFCTAQGNINSLNKKANTLFGNMYLKAEMRIINDLINGKTFESLKQFNEKWEYIVKGKPIST